MPKVLVSLDEIDRVKRLNGITTNIDLAQRLGVHRNTLHKYLKTRELDQVIIDGLVRLGARPSRILVLVSESESAAA